MAGRAAGQVTDQEAGAVAERVARASYGRLVALLAASTRDIALAEDALADAFERALRTWPTTGVPDNPQGWLMTVARNRIRDLLASAAVRTAAPLDDHFAAHAHRVRPGRDPRQAAGAALRMRAPGHRPRGAHSAHAPSRARLRRGPHRSRVRGAARSDGTAPGPGQAPHPRRRASRSGCRRGRTCPNGCPRCSKPSTAPTRSTGSTSTTAYANRSPTRPGGWPCSPLACSTPSPRRGASPLCSRCAQSRAPARASTPWPPLDEQDTALWDRSLIAEGEALLRRAHALGAPSDGSSSRPRSSPRTATGPVPGLSIAPPSSSSTAGSLRSHPPPGQQKPWQH